jgi:hypothetical protein
MPQGARSLTLGSPSGSRLAGSRRRALVDARRTRADAREVRARVVARARFSWVERVFSRHPKRKQKVDENANRKRFSARRTTNEDEEPLAPIRGVAKPNYL